MADGHLLRRAAERAGQHPFYLASSLLAYARAERLDDAGLAACAGCDVDSLPALLLCRRPSGEGSVFRADVEAIADRFGLDAQRLAKLLRAADALVALGGAATDHAGGLLAAARDRATDEGEGDHPHPSERMGSEAQPGEDAP